MRLGMGLRKASFRSTIVEVLPCQRAFGCKKFYGEGFIEELR